MATITAEPVEQTALVAVEAKATPLPVFRGVEMTQAVTAYREVQQALDRAMPDQIMTLDGKSFRKKAYWKAIAVAFNLTVELVEERREVHGELENGGDNYHYFVTYRASTPGGRSATGDGACSASEKQRGRMKASEHNVRSHSHTRACNRAISNLVGFGEVSAEEVDREDTNGRPVAVQPKGLVRPPKYDDWLDDMISKADEGTAELERAWTSSAREYRRYVTIMEPEAWTAIKAKAAGVKGAA
jgi:hypothetical protein